MRRFVTFVLVLAVSVVGCHRNKSKAPKYAQSDTTSWGGEQPAGAPPTYGTPGTCDASCSHYLQCKGNVDPAARQPCLAKCAQMGLGQQQLLDYEGTDCATAIWQAENTGGTSAGTGAAPTTSSECNGCAWDGSACIWLSQSNWGAGPYSGAASSCNAACCPGH
jgi:hypothetical protein